MRTEKITTNDCVHYISYTLNESPDISMHSSDMTNVKNWKRISKRGSGVFVRTFFNLTTNYLATVTATDFEFLKLELTQNLKKETTKSDDLYKDFPNVRHFKYATVYSKKQFGRRDFEDFDNDQDLEETELSGDSVIGIISDLQSGWSDSELDDIDIIIKFHKDTIFYSNCGDLTCDAVVYFRVDDNKYYVPAQEPQNINSKSGFEECGNEENANHLWNLFIKYKLTDCLISM